jgi:hypothetical protein
LTFVPPPFACCCWAQWNQAAFVFIGIAWIELSLWPSSESNLAPILFSMNFHRKPHDKTALQERLLSMSLTLPNARISQKN